MPLCKSVPFLQRYFSCTLAPRHPAWQSRSIRASPKPATTSITHFFLYTTCYPVKACGHRKGFSDALCSRLEASDKDAGRPASGSAAGPPCPVPPRRDAGIPFEDRLHLLETSPHFTGQGGISDKEQRLHLSRGPVLCSVAQLITNAYKLDKQKKLFYFMLILAQPPAY